jgi:hypothetical protein
MRDCARVGSIRRRLQTVVIDGPDAGAAHDIGVLACWFQATSMLDITTITTATTTTTTTTATIAIT